VRNSLHLLQGQPVLNRVRLHFGLHRTAPGATNPPHDLSLVDVPVSVRDTRPVRDGLCVSIFFLTTLSGSNSSQSPEYLDRQNVNIVPLGSGIMICSAIFATYCIIHIATTRSVDRQPAQLYQVNLLGIAALGGFIVANLAVRAQYGPALGQEAAADAGFIFGTLNYCTQSNLIPPLILLVMRWHGGIRTRFIVILVLCTLAAFFIILSAITTSKAGMLFFRPAHDAHVSDRTESPEISDAHHVGLLATWRLSSARGFAPRHPARGICDMGVALVRAFFRHAVLGRRAFRQPHPGRGGAGPFVRDRLRHASPISSTLARAIRGRYLH
jgi:hypothetical protein